MAWALGRKVVSGEPEAADLIDKLLEVPTVLRLVVAPARVKQCNLILYKDLLRV